MSGIVNRVGAKSSVVNTFTSQGIDDNSTGTTGLTIDSSGYVKRNTLPRVRAYLNVTNFDSSTSDTRVPFSGTRISSSDYSTSNHRFTAPIAGLYWVAWGGTINMSGADKYATTYVKVNGSTTPTCRLRASTTTSGYYKGFSCVTLLNLNSSDYIEIWAYTQAGGAEYEGNEFEYIVVFAG